MCVWHVYAGTNSILLLGLALEGGLPINPNTSFLLTQGRHCSFSPSICILELCFPKEKHVKSKKKSPAAQIWDPPRVYAPPCSKKGKNKGGHKLRGVPNPQIHNSEILLVSKRGKTRGGINSRISLDVDIYYSYFLSTYSNIRIFWG